MIIQAFDETDKIDENFVKLNERALSIEETIESLGLDELFTNVILLRINELFTVYKKKAFDKEMQSHLFILEVGIHELCMVLENVIKNK